MAQSGIALREVDHVSIKVVVDNSIDLLMVGTDVADRRPLGNQTRSSWMTNAPS